MDQTVAIWILLGSFFLLALIRMPISLALGVSSILTALYLRLPLVVIAQRMAGGISSFPLMAIPFFILAGQLMTEGKLVDRLVNLANVFVGRIRGGLGMINAVDSMFFGGISGSAVADVSSLGPILIPAMVRKGYHLDFSIALTVTTAVQAVLIPPSHNAIIYSLAAGGVSVGRLFLGGMIPGILLGLSFIGANYVMAVVHDYPREDPIPFRRAVQIVGHGLLTLMVAVIIMGGIVTGIFTATESAAIAAVYAAILCFLVYRDVPISHLGKVLRGAVGTVSMVFLLIATSSAFGWLLAYLQVPAKIAAWLLGLTSNRYLLLALINVFLLFLGCVMDMAPAIVIVTPILLPVVVRMGIDPVHFGIILLLNLGIGLCTPPVGNALFVGCAIGGARMEQVVQALLICYIPMLVVLILVTYYPPIVMWVPNLVMPR